MTVTASNALCSICQSPIGQQEARVRCPSCNARYHQECWQENGGCAVYGCASVPPTETRRELEIPASYWGQETKPCPVCATMIQAAALRCKGCGTTFKDARPRDSREFASQTGRDQRIEKLKSRSILIFVLCLIPLTTIVGVCMGIPWYLSNRQDIDAMPGSHSACAKIGIAVGCLQLLILVLVAIIVSVAG